MISWGRLCAWMAALGAPVILIQPWYRRALATASTYVLNLLGEAFRIRELAVQQPLHVAMFAALCLATRGAVRGKVIRAITIGVPALAILGLAIVVGVSAAFNELRRYGATPADPLPRALAALIDGLPWIAAPVLWFSFLGGSGRASPPDRASRA